MQININYHIRYLSTCLFLILSVPAVAQNVKPADPSARTGFTKIFDYDASVWLMIFLFFIMALTIFVLYSSLKVVLRHYSPSVITAEKEKESKLIASKEIKESLWTRFDRKFLTKAVPLEREADVMLDHNYDGIRELDNSLPPWWKWGFVFTIIFAIVYLISYHVAGTGKLQMEEYQDELVLAQQLKEERIRLTGEFVNEENVKALTDAEALGAGKDIFSKNCVACHLSDGGGSVGPNLTDNYWIHGGGIKNIFTTITNGVPAKGMISWKTQLAPKQIQIVASYILTFQGTKPTVAKEPQGEKWVEPAALSTDSSSMVTSDSTLKK